MTCAENKTPKLYVRLIWSVFYVFNNDNNLMISLV